MGTIKDKKKFKRKEEQQDPTNPKRNNTSETNDFNIDSTTIKDKQNKK